MIPFFLFLVRRGFSTLPNEKYTVHTLMCFRQGFLPFLAFYMPHHRKKMSPTYFYLILSYAENIFYSAPGFFFLARTTSTMKCNMSPPPPPPNPSPVTLPDFLKFINIYFASKSMWKFKHCKGGK